MKNNNTKNKNTRKNNAAGTDEPKWWSWITGDTLRFSIGMVLVFLAVFMLVAFISYLLTGAADQSVLESATISELTAAENGVQNSAGSLGAKISDFLINRCWGVASAFIILFVAVLGVKLMRLKDIKLWKWFLVCAVLMIWTSVFLAFVFEDQYKDSFIYLGGMHGYNVSKFLQGVVGVPGLILLLFATALCFLICMSHKTVDWLRNVFTFDWLRKKGEGDIEIEPDGNPVVLDLSDGLSGGRGAARPAVEPVFTMNDNSEPLVVAHAEEVVDRGSLHDPVPNDKEPELTTEVAEGEETVKKNDQKLYDPRLDLPNYKLPKLDLLKKFDDKPTIDSEEQKANSERIIQTLRSFDIEVTSIHATVGPTITLYEMTPAPGIRISKIRGLEDDIAMSLSANGIRIIAPIPGKGTIGIEVPNKNAKVVSGQSIIGSQKFQETKFDLPMALGKTISNEVFMVDLCKMPHILVAGATGQGKSVGLNAMITSLLYKRHPAELKFVLVDPKKVEFSIYTKLENYFLAELEEDGEPVITDKDKVVKTLNSVVKEMEERYQLLQSATTRNIKEYNSKFLNRQLNPEKGHRFLPYIVVVVDEFADLIMTAGKEVETPITRIAQLARAVGIHMIIATQRPTTNIITGTIKANFPARIAFKVASMTDSRTILDRPGANQLVGRGDMLFLNGMDPVRVQCAFIDTPEVQNIVDYISDQQGYTHPFYLPEVEMEGGGGVGDFDSGRKDALFDDAARLIVGRQQGSTSLIQREFSIGYNRAGRIMDQLEKAGIVGPQQGAKPRDVLIMDLLELDNRLKEL